MAQFRYAEQLRQRDRLISFSCSQSIMRGSARTVPASDCPSPPPACISTMEPGRTARVTLRNTCASLS